MTLTMKRRPEYPTIVATLMGIAAGTVISAAQYLPVIREYPIVHALVIPHGLYGMVALLSGFMTSIAITQITLLTNWWTNPRLRLITASSRHTRTIWLQTKATIWLLLSTVIISCIASQIDTVYHPVGWVRLFFWITALTALANTAQLIGTMLEVAALIRAQEAE